ncbi:MAG TPA: 30S ribosomal protein S20 [Soehngenia sp.]|jgi:SSU ribosomal protein S20P|nr:30S ribosomal protein S20 [Soehngenia sp.]HPP31061.1 30S ribosomal protein S20 [Soehngenia sp.]
MANIKSAEKRILVTQKKTALNRARKSEIKTYIKKFESALQANQIDEARSLLKTIDKKLKRAAHKNVIHMNQASRKISRLTKKLNQAM